jgi:hypothetical protein
MYFGGVNSGRSVFIPATKAARGILFAVGRRIKVVQRWSLYVEAEQRESFVE